MLKMTPCPRLARQPRGGPRPRGVPQLAPARSCTLRPRPLVPAPRRRSLRPRFYVEAHLQRLFRDADAAPAEDDAAGPPAAGAPPPVLPTAAPAALAEANAGRHDWLAEGGRQNRQPTVGRVRRRSERRADLVASTTDPDATPMDTTGGVRLGYKTHYVVDGGKARVVVAALVTPAEVRDNQPAADLLWHARFRWGLRPRQVTGDKHDATFELIAALEDAGIRAYVPLPDWDRRPPYYGPSRFAFDPARDEYRCPQGHPLRRHHVSNRVEAWIYRADKAICAARPVRAACTDSRLGRSLARSFWAGYVDWVRAYQGTPAYEKALRMRSVWVEPLFGEAKDWHGLRRFRLRRLPKVNTQALLTGAGQNPKRLLRRRGWGRRPWPGGPRPPLRGAPPHPIAVPGGGASATVRGQPPPEPTGLRHARHEGGLFNTLA